MPTSLKSILDDVAPSAAPNFAGRSQTLSTLFSRNNGFDIINLLLFAAGILLLFYLILGGLQLMMSRGDPKGVQQAQAKITNAVVGFFITFVAFWIVQLLGNFLGLSGITDTFINR